MLIFRTRSLMFDHFAWCSFEVRLSYRKCWNFSQVPTCMSSAYPPRTSSGQSRSPFHLVSQEVHRRIFLHRYSYMQYFLYH
jgi:hypothetical protein